MNLQGYWWMRPSMFNPGDKAIWTKEKVKTTLFLILTNQLNSRLLRSRNNQFLLHNIAILESFLSTFTYMHFWNLDLYKTRDYKISDLSLNSI